MQQDLVTLVNEQDEIIGQMDKFEAHRNPAKLHRAISVYLFNSKGELLIQQRSTQKIVGALQWGNTCCGNVWPGESYEECARRRLHVELGITEVTLTDIHTFLYQTPCNAEYSEHEMDHIFVGIYEGNVIPNPEEVAEYEYFDWEILSQQTWNVSEVSHQIWGQKLLDKEWFPWFVKMMGDSQLSKKVEAQVEK